MRNTTLIRNLVLAIVAVGVAVGAAPSRAADDHVEATFAEGAKRVLRLNVAGGSIRIEASEGNTVRVTATGTAAQTASRGAKEDSRAEGLSRVTQASTGLLLVEDDGLRVVLGRTLREPELKIIAPRDAALEIVAAGEAKIVVVERDGDVDVTSDGGEVYVHGATGAIHIESERARLFLTDVTGPIEANTSAGAIDVVLRSVSADRPIWLNAAEGPVDVTLPEDARANMNLRSTWGDIYSDFDLALRTDKKNAGNSEMAPLPVPSAMLVKADPAAIAVVPRPAAAPTPSKAPVAGRTQAEEKTSVASETLAADEAVEVDNLSAPRRQVARAPEAPPAPRGYTGTINGGGADIRITTGAANIYIRVLRADAGKSEKKAKK